MIVVADTSPISNLIECDLLHLLCDLYGALVIPEAVRRELAVLAPVNREYDVSSHRWIEVRHPVATPRKWKSYYVSRWTPEKPSASR